MGMATGLVCKNLVVDATYPSWRRQTIYYRDVQELGTPFHLHDKALLGVAAALAVLSVATTTKILHVASLGTLAEEHIPHAVVVVSSCYSYSSVMFGLWDSTEWFHLCSNDVWIDPCM